MARPLRLEFPGAVYHLTARGNARAPIVDDDTDRHCFLEILAQVIKQHHWRCHAYCLMDNHYHLLIETPDANLSRGMRQLNGRYTQTFNRRHGRVGHLFQGRFKAIVVDKDNYLLELCRYIALNPVRAKMVKHPKAYPWSSYRAITGLSKGAEFLTRDWILGQFARRRQTAEKRLREFIQQGIDQPSPWGKLTAQIFLGPESFVKTIMRARQSAATLKEIPRRQRFAARPSLKVLFPASGFKNKAERDRAIHQAHREHGYTLTDIGRQLDLHYTTISKVVSRGDA
ncbi:MAG: transposase [Gammaproteobacteria bacterium]|nr:transposase [Gammaproteobacteria bacterium]